MATEEVDPSIVRAALRRGAAVELLRGEPTRAVSYLRRHLGLCTDLSAPTRALAEHALIDSLLADGNHEDARLVLRSSSVEPDVLPRLDRLIRARISLELGIESDSRQLAELASADEVPVGSVLSVLLDAAGERDISEASGIYDALALTIRRACQLQAWAVPGKRLARCAQRYERAGRPGDAATCWQLIWLRRRNQRGENDPKTLAALEQFRRLRSAAQVTQLDQAHRLYALARRLLNRRESTR